MLIVGRLIILAATPLNVLLHPLTRVTTHRQSIYARVTLTPSPVLGVHRISEDSHLTTMESPFSQHLRF